MLRAVVRRALSGPSSSSPSATKTPQEFLALQSGVSASEALSSRQAIIVAPAPSVMQQAKRPEQSVWLLKFEPLMRWSNPLTGWTASRDPFQSIRIKFDSKDSAVAFADAHGIKYRVQETHLKKRQPKSYATNFKWKGKAGPAEPKA